MQKRILSWVLALAMIATMFSCLGISAFADETGDKMTVTSSNISDESKYADPTSDVEGYRQLNAQMIPSAAYGAGFNTVHSLGTGDQTTLKEATVYPSSGYTYSRISKGFVTQNLSVPSFWTKDSAGTIQTYGRDDGGFYTVTAANGKQYLTEDTEETTAHAYSLYYDFGSTATVYDFVLGSQGSNNAWLTTGYYALFASEARADLFKADSKVATFCNTNKESLQVFHSDAGITARYFALVIYDPVGKGTNSLDRINENYYCQPRISMLKIFGTQKELSYTVTEDTPASGKAFDGIDADTSLVKASPTVSAWSANSEGFDVTKYKPAGLANLYNNSESGEFMFGNALVDNVTHHLFNNDANDKAYTTESEAYADIRYDFNKPKNIKQILVLNHGGDILRTGYYQIFAGNDLDTLYDEPLYTLKNYTAKTQRQLLTAKNEGDLSARYVAIRIYDPYCVATANDTTASFVNRYIRLLQFNVYGYAVEDENFFATSYNGTVAEYQNKVDITKSVIGGKNPAKQTYINKYKGVEEPTTLNIGCGDKEDVTVRTLTDTTGVNNGNILIGGGQLFFAQRPSEGSADVSGIYDNEDMQYGDIAYDLGGVVDVNQLAFYGHTSSSLTIYHYRVSFANSVDDLFTDNAVVTSTDYYNTGNYVVLDATKTIRAKYVGFRIICGITNACSNIYNNGDYARMCHLDVFGDKVETKKVTFLDMMGNTIQAFDVVPGATLTEDQINTAIAAVPEIFGYNFTGNWSDDVTGAITEDLTVTPIYEKDTATTYTVKVTYTDGSEDTLTKNFDDRLELQDAGATYFKTSDGAILGVGTTAAVYVCGDMDIVASTEAAPAEASVSIVKATKSVSGGKNAMNVFVHANASDKTITGMGVIFISGTTYNTVKDTEWTKDTLTAANKTFAEVKSDKGYSNFMGRMLGITTEKTVTRVAKAYVTFSDGTTVYSDAAVLVFGE